MKIKSHVTLLFVLLGVAFGFAQTQLSGSVTDANGEPIPGATIIVQGTNNGVHYELDIMQIIKFDQVWHRGRRIIVINVTILL
jgi:hypothetical protein